MTLAPAYRAFGAADPVPGTADEADAEQEAFRARAHQVIRQARRGSAAYGWLEVALIRAFGRTHGMALVGLKVVRSGGASIGITGAFARAFGPTYLIRALTTPLRGVGPSARVERSTRSSSMTWTRVSRTSPPEALSRTNASIPRQGAQGDLS